MLLAVLISRSPKEVQTHVHVQLREETAKLSHVRQFLYEIPARWKSVRHHAQRELLKRILQILCRWMLALRNGGKGKKGKDRGKNKGDRNRHDGKGKGANSSNGTCNECGAHGHKRVDCPVETVAPLESESVTEPNEEPAEIESLEWPYASEHDGEEAMASLNRCAC